MNFFYQSIPLFFLSIILLFFKGYIDSKNGIMDGNVTQFDLKVLKFFSETRKIEGKKMFVAQRFARMESRSGSGTPDLRNGSGTSFGGGINPSGR